MFHDGVTSMSPLITPTAPVLSIKKEEDEKEESRCVIMGLLPL